MAKGGCAEPRPVTIGGTESRPRTPRNRPKSGKQPLRSNNTLNYPAARRRIISYRWERTRMTIIHRFEMPLDCLTVFDVVAGAVVIASLAVGTIKRNRAGLIPILSRVCELTAWVVSLVNMATISWLCASLLQEVSAQATPLSYKLSYGGLWTATFLKYLSVIPLFILFAGLVRCILEGMERKRSKTPNQASHATSEPAPGAASSAHEG